MKIVPTHKAGFSEQWRELRFYETVYYVVLVGGGAFVIFMLLHYKQDFYWAFGCHVIALTVLSWKCRLFRCPQCNGRFFKATPFSHNDFRRTCPHCGLKKWQND